MKGFMKFLVLAIAGFGLGAGAAWLQSPHSGSMPQLQVASEAKPAAKPAEKKEGAASPAMTEADEGTAENSSLTGHDAAAAKTAPEEKPPEEKTAPAVASADAAVAKVSGSEAEGKRDASPEVMQNLAAARGDVPPKEVGVGGAFSLTDHNGNKVTEKSWPGKYLLVFFGFTNCPDICPVTLDKLTSALDQLGDDAAKVQPLFISIDSFRDKPNVLKEYVGHFHKSFLGLTGTEDQIKAVEDAYKVYASRHDNANGHDYSFDHSAFVYFMAPDGKMAEIIRTDEKASDVADMMRPYLEGKKEASGQTP